MKPPINSRLMTIMASLVAVAFLLWTVQLIWHRAGEIDRNLSRFGAKNQLMHRKSEAMHDILDEMIAGNLGSVHSAAKRMARYGETIDGYLASESYDIYGMDFHQSVEDLAAAAAESDAIKAKEAALRLERSCIECHELLNSSHSGKD